jgi:voltage-gated potassium channel
MTASMDPGREARPPYHRIVWSFLRATGSTIVLVTVYYLLPLDHSSEWAAIAMLVGGLLLFVGLVSWQVRSILRSRYPALRAMEALAASVPLFLLLFAGIYVVMASLSFRSFGVHLTHTDGLYFAVTVFSTVGFGDITAKSELARLVVTVQMLADLLVIGLGLRVILGAVTRSRQQRSQDASTG